MIKFIMISLYLKKIKFNSNNAKIDEIINEEDELKKEELIEKLKIDDTIDFTSSGYAAQLFSIFSNNLYFCVKENKEYECIICGNKKLKRLRKCNHLYLLMVIILTIQVFLIYFSQNIRKYIHMLVNVGKIRRKMYFV